MTEQFVINSLQGMGVHDHGRVRQPSVVLRSEEDEEFDEQGDRAMRGTWVPHRRRYHGRVQGRLPCNYAIVDHALSCEEKGLAGLTVKGKADAAISRPKRKSTTPVNRPEAGVTAPGFVLSGLSFWYGIRHSL